MTGMVWIFVFEDVLTAEVENFYKQEGMLYAFENSKCILSKTLFGRDPGKSMVAPSESYGRGHWSAYKISELRKL